MCSREMRELCFVIVADHPLIFRRSQKMGRPFRVGMKRCCEWRQSKNQHRRSGTARRCRPTIRRRGHSQMDSQRDNFWVEDKRKLSFYLRANGEKDLRIRAEVREMKWKCK